MSAAASSPPSPQQPATVADLLALEDTGHGFELVDGVIVEKETSPRHGNAQGGAVRLLAGYHRKAGGGGDRPGGWWILTEVTVQFTPHKGYRPDVAGWLRERMPELPTEPVTEIVPDWICEVLSPSNARNDLIKKKRTYWQHKVPHYWLIDPIGEVLTVLRWTPDGYLEVLTAGREERVRAEPFGQVELQVGVLFGDDEE